LPFKTNFDIRSIRNNDYNREAIRLAVGCKEGITPMKKQSTQYNRIPDSLTENADIDGFDIAVYNCIAKFNPCFISYSKMRMITKFSRDSINKSLKKLEYYKFITRYKKGRRIYYITEFSSPPHGPLGSSIVRYMDRYSPPDGLLIVHPTDSNQINEPYQLTTGMPSFVKERLMEALKNTEMNNEPR